MGKSSTKENKSIYQLVREGKGYSRAQAADLMTGYIEEYRLVRLENGDVSLQPADVLAMSKAYNKPELRNYYCTHECPIGKIDAPQVKMNSNIHELLVNMLLSLESVNSNKMRLMEILADGKIQSDEIEDFEKIEKELEHISMAVESIQLWCERAKNENK